MKLSRRHFLRNGLWVPFVPVIIKAQGLRSPSFVAAVTKPAAAGGGTHTGDLVTETFETNPGYDMGWSGISGTGTLDPDYSTTGLSLEGSECCHLVYDNNQRYITLDLGAAVALTQFWGRVRVRITTDAGTDCIFLSVRDTANGGQAGLRVASNEQMVLAMTNAVSGATTDSLAVDTSYYVWFYWKQSSGANDGISRVAFSTDTTRPTSGNQFKENTACTATYSIRYFRIGQATNQTQNMYIDEILISSTGYPGEAV